MRNQNADLYSHKKSHRAIEYLLISACSLLESQSALSSATHAIKKWLLLNFP